MDGDKGPLLKESQMISSFREMTPRVGLSIAANGGSIRRLLLLKVLLWSSLSMPLEKLCSKGLGSSSNFAVRGSVA